MEVSSGVGQQLLLLLPIGFVIVCAALVFVFGFNKSVELPNFKHLRFSSADKKTKGKKKTKDKKAQNGHATAVADDSKTLKQSNKSDSKSKKSESKKSPAKGAKKDNKKVDKKGDKSSDKENRETPKPKKGAQKVTDDRPKDFDDSGWETALSRKDKKNKRKVEGAAASSPDKSSKKSPDSKGAQSKKPAQSPQSGGNKAKSVNSNSSVSPGKGSDDSAKNKKKARKD
ncbi:hypothetical protein RUM43_001922 [Polyplax serrata]|uniref:Uncharacterized protein n=1 Tax=Polyplax serrata TaxID=468196 RepID=A0AAN8XUR9_POLSC